MAKPELGLKITLRRNHSSDGPRSHKVPLFNFRDGKTNPETRRGSLSLPWKLRAASGLCQQISRNPPCCWKIELFQAHKALNMVMGVDEFTNP